MVFGSVGVGRDFDGLLLVVFDTCRIFINLLINFIVIFLVLIIFSLLIFSLLFFLLLLFLVLTLQLAGGDWFEVEGRNLDFESLGWAFATWDWDVNYFKYWTIP